MKTMSVTKQDFMKVTDIKDTKLFSVIEDKCKVEYEIGIGIFYLDIRKNIERNTCISKLFKCFKINFSKYELNSTEIRMSRKSDTMMITHVMSIDEYLKVFKTLTLYVTRLSGEKYEQYKVEICNQKSFYDFLDELTSVHSNIVDKIIGSIDVNKNFNYVTVDMCNKYSLLKVEDKIYKVQNIGNERFRIIDGKELYTKEIYNLVESSDLLKQYKTKFYSFGFGCDMDMRPIDIPNDFGVEFACKEYILLGEKYAIIRVIYPSNSNNETVMKIMDVEKDDTVPSYIHYTDIKQPVEDSDNEI